MTKRTEEIGKPVVNADMSLMRIVPQIHPGHVWHHMFRVVAGEDRLVVQYCASILLMAASIWRVLLIRPSSVSSHTRTTKSHLKRVSVSLGKSLI